MKKIITIVGCGAVGAAQLYHIVHQLIQDKIARYFEIVIFEKSANLGHGIAYAEDEHCNILNRSAETMSLIHNKYNDFKKWLMQNKEKWQKTYPTTEITNKNDNFLPRALFGNYCEDIVQQVILYARMHKLKISIIFDEVIAIDKYNDDYKIKTKNDWKFHSNIVILALGNLPSQKFEKINASEKFHSSPYPTQKLKTIPANSSVGIMGSRLSAIDAAIALHHQEHKGNIVFISRGGFLPSVRSPYYYHELKVLSARVIKELTSGENRNLSLKNVIKLLIQEVTLLSGRKLLLSDWLKRPIDPKSYIENEFKTCRTENKIAWQSVLIAFNHIVEYVWHELSDIDKKIFNKFYKSKFMAYRVGIPIQNARKIYNLLLTKQLSLINNFKSIELRGGKFVANDSKSSYEFDYIIDATGQSDDLINIQSPLISNMLMNGLIKQHVYGGIEIDFKSSRLVKSDSIVEKNLYAVGNLTSGTYFFTSVLELNVKHAYQIAQNIVTDFIDTQHHHKVSAEVRHFYTPYIYHDQFISQNKDFL